VTSIYTPVKIKHGVGKTGMAQNEQRLAGDRFEKNFTFLDHPIPDFKCLQR